MPKPGQMKNLARPMSADGLDAVRACAATSSNTPETYQLAGGPNRFSKAGQPGPGGQAMLERDAIMADQGDANTTRSTGETYKTRRAM